MAICTGRGRVFLWSPAGASVVHVPLRGFQAIHVAWSNAGTSFVLCDRDAFCCAYLTGWRSSGLWERGAGCMSGVGWQALLMH